MEQLDQVHVLSGVGCHRDPAWVLLVLRRHAASLQELQLYNVSRGQLLELQSMPGLRRLRVCQCQQDLRDSPLLPGPWRGRLEWLRVEELPKQTVQSLLSAQRDSLQELELRVGTPPQTGNQENWPIICGDLPAMVQGLHRLQTLTLRRYRHTLGCTAHLPVIMQCLLGMEYRKLERYSSLSGCPVQLAALRAVLPGCTVKCNNCCG